MCQGRVFFLAMKTELLCYKEVLYAALGGPATPTPFSFLSWILMELLRNEVPL